MRDRIAAPYRDDVLRGLMAQTRAAATAYTQGEDWANAARMAESELVKPLSRLYREAIVAFARRTHDDILNRAGKDGGELIAWEEAAAAFIRTKALRRVKLLSDASIALIRSVIDRGIVEGQGVQEIARTIRRDVGEINTRTRAERIVRTEVIGASNEGAVRGAESTGLPIVKNWLATLGPRTRPSHLAANGQQVPLNGSFTVGGATLEYPGDPSGPPEEVINCRCAVTFEVTE